MATQTTYVNNLAPGLPGQVVDMQPSGMRSATVEAATFGFGVPVFQGAGVNGGKAKVNADTVNSFIGVSVRDRSVMEGDGYKQYESMRVMRFGSIWVTAAVAVTAGQPVFILADGTWSNVTGTNALELLGARWDTTTATTNKLAAISIK